MKDFTHFFLSKLRKVVQRLYNQSPGYIVARFLSFTLSTISSVVALDHHLNPPDFEQLGYNPTAPLLATTPPDHRPNGASLTTFTDEISRILAIYGLPFP